ncbi:MAG: hypothetical protein H0W88_11925 [Parachlamydiaceae bacterium]|nr:hypothetical protein [Parachlamydiaceae bacterium]
MRSFLTSKLFIALFTLLVIVAIFIASLPTILSTSWGHRQVISLINRSIPGNVEIHQLDLHWGHGQSIEGFLLKDTEGNLILEFEKFYTEASLWQLIKKSTHLGQTQIEDLNAAIVTDEHGVSNLQKALGIDIIAAFSTIPPSTIFLSDTYADVNLFGDKKPLSLNLKGETKQEKLTGSFEMHAVLPHLLTDNWADVSKNAQQLMTIEGSKEATLQAKIQNFPVDLLDRILALKKPELNGLFRTILGDKLNVVLDKESNTEGFAFNLSLLAPLLQGNVKGKIVNNNITLQEPSIFTFNFIPASINSFLGNHFKILEQTQLKVTLSEFTLPLSFLEKNSETNPCAIGLSAQAQLTNAANLDVKSIGELKVLNLNCDIQSPVCAKDIQIKVVGKAKQKKLDPFDINFSASLKKPTSLDNLMEEIQEGSKINIKLNHFPLGLIPGLSEQQDLIKMGMGSFVDLTSSLNQTKYNQFDTTVSLNSDRLSIKDAHFKVGNEIELRSPITFQYTPEQKLLNLLLKDKDIQIKEASPLDVTISEFKLPLGKKGSVKALVKIPSTIVTHTPSSYSFALKNTQIKADGPIGVDLALQMTSDLNLLNPDNSNSPFLGKNSQVSIISTPSLNSSGGLDFSHIKGTLESELAKLFFEGNIFSDLKLTLTNPINIKYQLTPGAVEAIPSLNQPTYPKLLNSPNLSLKIEPFQINLKNPKLESMIMKGNFLADSLVLQNTSGSKATLKDLDVPWEINSPLNLLRINIKGEAYGEASQKPSHLSTQFLISNWLKDNVYDPSHLKIEAVSNLTGLPTSLVSSFIAKEDLSPVLGSIFDLELNALIDRDQNTPGHWDMILDSPLMHVKARLRVGETITMYESNSPSIEIRWTLTPQGYDYLNGLTSKSSKSLPKLANDVTLKAFFTDFSIPLKTTDPDKDGGIINVSFETNDISWKDQPIPAFRLKGQLQSPHVKKQLNFNLHTTSVKDSTSLAINGQISNMFDTNWKPQIELSDSYFDIQAKRLPAEMIRFLLLLDPSYQQHLVATIGPEIDAQITSEISKMAGPITAHINGKNGDINLDGKLKKGILQLNKPFEWKIQFSPELSKLLTKQNIPVLNSAIGADKPFLIKIDPKKFALPVMPFNLNQIAIPKGTIDLGQVRFRNEGVLNSIMSVLKPIQADQISIWFTPLYFDLSKGVLLIKRMDMLVAQKYNVATWGQVDLNTTQVDMILGVTGNALMNAVDIQGIDNKYMLQIPLKGKDGKVDIDKKKAIARITALVAQNHANDTVKILGNVIDFATTMQEQPAPEPTTQPLPWEDASKGAVNQESNTNTNPSKGKPTPPVNTEKRNSAQGGNDKGSSDKGNVLKEIEKGASSLFDYFSK